MLTSPTPALKRRLATVIRERRVRLGLSQEAFADQLEMDRAFYGRMENGQNMTLQTLERIADGLGIKPSLLLREAESLVDGGCEQAHQEGLNTALDSGPADESQAPLR